LPYGAKRAALLPRRKPYWHPIDKGLHVGYYKGARSSTWHARFFVGAGRYEEARLGTTDDTHHADGRTVLDYPQAVARSLEWRKRHDAAPVPRQDRRRGDCANRRRTGGVAQGDGHEPGGDSRDGGLSAASVVRSGLSANLTRTAYSRKQ
jgi:hypothetical protein